MPAPLVDSTPQFVEETYRRTEERLKEIRQRFGRPLTYAEKVLLGHLDDPAGAELNAGESYIMLRPDRVALQDATGQMALLQFMQAGRPTVAVPTTVHCDHLVQARVGATSDVAEAVVENEEVYDFLRSSSNKYGAGFWGPGSGIIHQVLLENYALPRKHDHRHRLPHAQRGRSCELRCGRGRCRCTSTSWRVSRGKCSTRSSSAYG